MFEHSHILLSPDAGDAGSAGGGTATESPTPTTALPQSEAAGASSSPETGQPTQSQPDGHHVTNEEYRRFQRAEQVARDRDRTYQRFKEAGYDTFDDALGQLQEYQKLQSDPTTQRLLQAIAQPQQADPSSITDPAQEKGLSQDSVQQMIQDAISQSRQQERRTEFDRLLNIEDGLIKNAVTSNPQLKQIFGEDGFEKALKNEGSLAQQATTALFDLALTQTRPTDAQGNPMPISDATAMNAAAAQVGKLMNALRTQALLDASPSNPGLPESSAANTVPRSPDDFGDPAQDRDRLAQDMHQTMLQEFNREVNAGTPLSQG